MNFQEAVKSCLTNYVTFSGRACRSEFWFWVLATILAQIVANIADVVLGVFLFTPVVVIGTFLPHISVAVRRLHDTGHSGWWWWLVVVPFGAFVLLYFAIKKGDPTDNKYGPARS